MPANIISVRHRSHFSDSGQFEEVYEVFFTSEKGAQGRLRFPVKAYDPAQARIAIEAEAKKLDQLFGTSR